MISHEAVAAKSRELHGLAQQLEVLRGRYTAYLMLYDSACGSNAADEITLRRDECHTLLDSILDKVMEVNNCKRELDKLMYG